MSKKAFYFVTKRVVISGIGVLCPVLKRRKPNPEGEPGAARAPSVPAERGRAAGGAAPRPRGGAAGPATPLAARPPRSGAAVLSAGGAGFERRLRASRAARESV